MIKEDGYSLKMSVTIVSSNGKLEQVESPSHPIEVVLRNNKKEALITTSKIGG